MVNVPDWVIALGLGAVFGIAIYKLLDPPEVPEEVVESIANSDWARAWAEKFCGGTGPEREECIRDLSRKVAKSLARGIM